MVDAQPEFDAVQKEYRWVAIGETFLPPCQENRPLDPVRVARIVAEYNDAAFGTPILSYREPGNRGPRGETYAIVSGQHRFAVAKEIGRVRVYCEVIYGLSLADESRLWLDEDNRKRQSGLARFHLNLQAKDADAVAIWEAVNGAGFIVARNTGDKSARSLRFVQALYATHRRGNLPETLRVLAASFGHDTKGIGAEILNGLSIVLKFRTGINTERLAKKLAAFGPSVVRTRYRGAIEAYGGDQRVTMANVVIGIYNNHLSGDSLVSPITTAETRATPHARIVRRATGDRD